MATPTVAQRQPVSEVHVQVFDALTSTVTLISWAGVIFASVGVYRISLRITRK
eukprot:CAMPEP_0177399752 /NCGR_PEP_ID=MMETSP0368-20130122/58665_1 /TAXON_ID=447022 ORGANISM="Scrippsiella hangoei-like, Strain SHHI-4" /NCGR_SAMPLE_ID=MMETSP0368 /ASSEMBLY_ACC=CAM_ASM_000363 /LENGTH=52 /DNA_ID=CAMNT_0018867049 /DNA_START=63 /DNA_END=218 /DNA_ORIENTATION=+